MVILWYLNGNPPLIQQLFGVYYSRLGILPWNLPWNPQAHLRRITEGAPRNAGVVVLNEAAI